MVSPPRLRAGVPPRSYVSRAAPFAARPFPRATSSAGCRTRLPRPATCAGVPRSVRPGGMAFATRRSSRRAARSRRARSRLPPLLRGLPVSQRLCADASARRRPAGAGVDPRRWVHRGWRPQLRRLQARRGRHRRGHDQLPSRRARVPRPSSARPAAGGPAGNYGLMDQIAALRWVRRDIAGSAGTPQRHDRRPVSRWACRSSTCWFASLARAVSAGDC